MTTGEIHPSRDEFRVLAAGHAVVPVTRRLLADGETPVGVYRKLGGGPGTFLLESAEHSGTRSRYSIIGVRAAATLTGADGEARWTGGEPPPGVPAGGDPLAVLRAVERALRAPRLPGTPPLMGGLVGYLSYDFVRRIERLPEYAVDDLGTPELRLLLCTDLAVLDHADGSCLLVANVFTRARGAADGQPAVDQTVLDEAALDAAYDDAVGRLDVMTAELHKWSEPTVAATQAVPPLDVSRFVSAMAPGQFQNAVERSIEEIRAGECFQIVVSQRFERATTADALDIYRVLRASNPSPYMYLLRFGDFDVVGTSPEAHVKVTGDRALLHPIAGSRPRGQTPEADAALAAELLADPKERAEHVMLVDLVRNDLGRVCVPGTVRVVEFAAVERYSHIMHIVSTVIGEVSPDHSAIDVLAATFPAGTLSGAPKVRAMEVIDELEPTRRGLYGGVVGYLDFGGDLDTAIAIRTALVRDGVAYVQAGAGVVADSDPDSEDRESRTKAAAVLRAIEIAETLRPPG
ncbi:anthranilate synthase component I [Frankia sp. CNm7]|uniref:Anthranilate synthase component 1 n=1 Tax=Frankia nepalensis TaxID=1836974 RepID=A0A937RPL8_9ACTN|nr:anthranilate synthase component I [Frankia nepalensis]MBL7500581.1 anthranilate synthase component I [Frankia nepalensis]MBL7509365.1 anthranilate synthase component I [Frankia nepalensis]MBL7524394.1 anthranilate synthase component I [Frankia nepalensis]MBL7630323.1 anthranilate synthase component I [Frankia nepalensis]